MKTEPIDYLLAAIFLSAIAAAAWASTAFLAVPIFRFLLGEYHVVADALVLLLAFGLVAALAVRLLLLVRPLAPGDYSMDASPFTRWKLLVVLSEFGRGALGPFTTEFSKPLVARLYGARIGSNTALGGRMTDLPLITIGSGCIFGINSVVTGHAITSGRIVLREVRFGADVTIGVGAVIMPGVEVGEGSIVAAGSIVTAGTTIPAGELWAGTPARRLKAIDASDARG